MPVPTTSADSGYDAIVVAGAASARFDGTDKAVLEVGGRTLVERAAAAVGAAGQVVIVGPRRPAPAGVTWCEERPSGGGPVAAFAAGLAATTADRVVLLAADLPFVAPAIGRLLAVDADLAVLVDASGRLNYLASAWRRDVARERLSSLGDVNGASMRRLVEGVRLTAVHDEDGWSDDCDTWEALEAARGRAAREGI